MSMLKSLITLGNYLLQHQNGIDVRWTAHLIEKIKQQHDAALEAERERCAKIADEEGAAPKEDGGSISRSDACDNIARAIRTERK